MDKYEIIAIILCLLIIIIVLIIFLSINKKDKEIIRIPLNNSNNSSNFSNNFSNNFNNPVNQPNYVVRPVQQTKFELGSACNNNLQCSSSNCSLGYCQTKGYTTGQIGSYCSNDLACDARLNCLNQTCVIHNTTDNWGLGCLNDSDCNSTTICLPLNNNNNRKVCQFPVGGSCLNSMCPTGFDCVNGQCLGLAGSVCSIDSNCLGSCDSKAILRLNLNQNKIVWDKFITVPANISFARIKSIEGEGLWGLDFNNGIYYTSFKNQTWILLYDSTLKIKNEIYSIIDMSVVNPKLMFLVYKSVNDSTYKLYVADNKSLKFYGNLYVKQKNINYKSKNCNSSSDSDSSDSYSSNSDSSYSSNSDSSDSSNSDSDSSDSDNSSFKLITKILGIDTIIDDDDEIQILIYGSDQKINYYVFSAVYQQTRFNYVGPYQNKLDSQSIVRFFLNNKNQSHSYNYIWNNKISTNGNFISPAVPANLTPAKIIDYDSQGRNLYFIATNNNNTNLYSNITDTNDALLIPGLLNSEARLSVTANNIYIFSKICN